MNISKLKIGWAIVSGMLNPFKTVVENLADYGLQVLNTVLNSISIEKRETIQAALNTAKRVLSLLTAAQWLCPTKWQTAYGKTVLAVQSIVDSLEDWNITADEIKKIREEGSHALLEWQSEDDETCIDCADCVEHD